MDSMRSLNTSLPAASSPRRQAFQPPEQLLQVFKQAALSVTNLYKAAASEHDKAYREGYQDLLGELLDFLDRENLGLQDGEGWKIRKWATERYSGTSNAGAANASEDEEDAEEEKRARSSSPAVPHKGHHDSVQQPLSTQIVPTSSPSHTRSESAPPIAAASAVEQPSRDINPPLQTYTVPQSDFTFQTSHHYPTIREMDMDTSEGNNGTVHINVLPRQARISRQNSRTGSRSTSSLGLGAGSKRRNPGFDFFDLGGFNGKDGFGGGGGGSGGNKRGRFN